MKCLPTGNEEEAMNPPWVHLIYQQILSVGPGEVVYWLSSISATKKNYQQVLHLPKELMLEEPEAEAWIFAEIHLLDFYRPCMIP